VIWGLLIYYLGYLIAIALYWNLGKKYYIPMLLNMGFNICLNADLLTGWNNRWVIVIHLFLFFIWVAYISELFKDRFSIGVAIGLIVGVFVAAIHPLLYIEGAGQEFWNKIDESIINIWSTSIFILVLTVLIKSTVVARLSKKFVDALASARKRFLFPIGLWAGIIAIPPLLVHEIPEADYMIRFGIAAYTMVWGWVAMELPFYIMYKRLIRKS
jgi:phosphate starvation-inducible membrane PsiE